MHPNRKSVAHFDKEKVAKVERYERVALVGEMSSKLPPTHLQEICAGRLNEKSHQLHLGELVFGLIWPKREREHSIDVHFIIGRTRI